MADPEFSALTILTEFFSAAHIEASARRTGFVRRASKITGKRFVALITVGQWSTAKTSWAQLAAKAAQLCKPVDVSPEAIHQRMNRRALAFLQDVLQTAFAKLHSGDTVCEEGLFTPFPRVHIADSTGFGLPDSLKDHFPGAGGSAGQAGAKIQLVWDYKSSTFAHFALTPWNIPDNKYVDTVVSLTRRGSLVLFDLGYFKLHAFAYLAAGKAYSLRWQVELIFKSWKSYLQLATLPTKTANSTLCYLYGRLLLILLIYGLCPSLRVQLWTKKRRELSELKLVRHLQAFADRWLQMLFEPATALCSFLHRACTTAERLVAKASRKRRTSAQRLHESLHTQNDFIEFTMALAA